MDVVWDGIISAEVLHEEGTKIRQQLANAAKQYDWPRVMNILDEHADLVNTTRPGGTSLFAPLHQAAYGGAPIEAVERLVRHGAWRTLQNARGERPVDVAERRGHRHLLGILEPRLTHRVPNGVLLKIQAHFHDVIRGRAAEQVQSASLRLPELEPLLEVDGRNIWFAVPGMYGGFSYQLQTDGVEAVLVSESWCRVVEGSGQRHEVTSAGSQLVEEGFA